MVTTFLYDVRDQLVGVRENSTTLGRFFYDYKGMRVAKQGDEGLVRYTYDDTSVLTQHDVDGATLAKYDYGPDRLLSLEHAAEGRQFYSFDALGSVVNLTKPDASIQARYQYDAWGHFRAETGSSWNAFTFTGHEKDRETGLFYFKARYYDPDTGRFINQDPYLGEIDTPPSLHRYLYAYSNPTVYVDPDGHKSVFGDATKQLENFREWLGEQNKQADNQLAAIAIGTAQFVTMLGEGITRPLDIAANLAQVATGVDDQQVRDELAGTKQFISDAADFVVHGDYVQAAKNVHQAAVNETVKALEGDATATANVTQVVLSAATLRSVTKGKPRITQENPSGPGVTVRVEQKATPSESMLHSRGQRVNPGERALTKQEYKRINRELRQNHVKENTRDWVIRNVSENFVEHSSVKVVKTSRERSFWRRWGGENKARERGAYGTSGPRTPEYTNKKLAVRKNWNDMTEQTRFRIKKGSVIVEGKAGPKIDVDGAPLPGGGHQILNIDLDNLIKK